MKRFVIALAAMAALAACKTTEANYRSAYETTVEHQKAQAAADAEAGIPVKSLTQYGRPKPMVTQSGDTLMLLTEPVALTPEGGATHETLRRYNVVVGQFRQIFNAKAMLARLREGAYPDAIILNTRLPLYYVITNSVATQAEAVKALRNVEADTTLRLASPLPFVLRPAHLAR